MAPLNFRTEHEPIAYSDSFNFFRRHYANGNGVSLLMESRSKNLAYGRQSILVPNAALRITGKNSRFCIQSLTETGARILGFFSKDDFSYVSNLRFEDDRIEGEIEKPLTLDLEESIRMRSKNTSLVLRTILNKFPELRDDHFGLYGAFAYDFSRNFESFGTRFADGGEPDFELYLPTTVISFDDIRETAQVKRIFFDGKNDPLEAKVNPNLHFSPSAGGITEDMSLSEYSAKVDHLVSLIKRGEFMQCVLSRQVGVPLTKHPLDSYTQLREVNPSPYSFYFSFGYGRYLYGASPEIHVKVDGSQIEIRPIAGTISKPGKPMADFEARLRLMNDHKERREHSMLVDLARSELNRLCHHGSVSITDLYTLEEYPNLIHLVSGVRGTMRHEYDALDALLTTIPAGTLSGAPKIEAMKQIELLEASRRNFYGGALGYLSFNGNASTGITIRSVFVSDGRSYVRAGAGVVADSTSEGESREIRLKSEKALQVLQ